MSIQEIEAAVAELSPEQLKEFSAWFEAYLAEVSGDIAVAGAVDDKNLA